MVFRFSCRAVRPNTHRLRFMGWYGEAVTEGLKFIKRRKFTAIGGMRACRPTQSFAEHDIKPQNFTSSVTPCQLLLEEKPINRTSSPLYGRWHGEAVTDGFKSHREQNISTKNQQGLVACLLIYAIKLKMPQERL